MSKKFQNDLNELYNIVGVREKELGGLFKIIEKDNNEFGEIRVFVDKFLEKINLSTNNENRLSALTRLISLRDEQLVQSLTKEGFDDNSIKRIKEEAYLWVKDFYLKRHGELLLIIKNKGLLNEFYRALLEGVHKIGIAMSFLQSEWTNHIINTINPELKNKFKDEVISYLDKHKLYDVDEKNEKADRSYSVLKKKKDSYEVLSYASFFENGVQKIVDELKDLVEILNHIEDKETDQKNEYILYFKSLKRAFQEKDCTLLIKRWQEVDRVWMSITSPIQVGHPLEYYEDHFRKSVALEWDVRLSNPNNIKANETYKNICYMYNIIFEKIGGNYKKIFKLTTSNLKRVDLYIGRPMFFYASEFNGLFSAQVVPNDETISKERGKKIYAFSDNILDSLRARPFLKIQEKIFGKEFMDTQRELIFRNEKLWHKIYEITTIGHEYGHILWLDSNTETMMNKNGVFKNIEEFKATTSGLVAFFMSENKSCKSHVLTDLIKRSVGLIAWMKTEEVEPYYCEGLIHLHALFETKVLDFCANLKIDTSDEKYEKIKAWYIDTYEILASHYLAKKDANEFLSNYALKKNGFYIPVNEKVKEFVNYYWNMHKKMGREIDDEIKKEDWVLHVE